MWSSNKLFKYNDSFRKIEEQQAIFLHDSLIRDTAQNHFTSKWGNSTWKTGEETSKSQKKEEKHMYLEKLVLLMNNTIIIIPYLGFNYWTLMQEII